MFSLKHRLYSLTLKCAFVRDNEQMFVSAHYAGSDLVPKFKQGELWKKVYGPIFIYLNTNDGADPLALWNDAKAQVCA